VRILGKRSKVGPAWLAGAWAAILSVPLICAAADTGSLTEALQREASGDLAGARAALEQDVKNGKDPAARAALAGFEDRHHQADRRDAFARWAAAETNPERKLLALRQVVLLDLMDRHNETLDADLGAYHAAGGKGFNDPAKRSSIPGLYGTTQIPGPLRSFARMAALSPDLAPEDLLPALSRNVVTNGYQAVAANEALEQTEYLKLLVRYVAQARELEQMAGKDQKIAIPACDSEQTGELLKILGYRMRGSCGTDVVLETVNATRAFLTVDSGFPLAELESDLRANHRFEMGYAPTTIPVLYGTDYWLSALVKEKEKEKETGNFIDAMLSDPSLCRLYLGLSKLDRPTADALRKEATAARLRVYAHVLDFFGGMFQIRNGAAVAPGSAQAWQQMVGVSPSNGAAFYEKLLTVDDGWMASYFDALARLEGPSAGYLTEPERMKRFYNAVKGKITTPGPARPVFRGSTELMLLTNGLRLDGNGQAHIPGNLDVWRNLFISHPHGKYDGKLTRAASSWRNGDDVVEALFALCRKAVENEPLKIFLAVNDVDRLRAQPVSASLAARLVTDYRSAGAQYSLFAEIPTLSEESINKYLDLNAATAGIHDSLTRADAIGSAQAITGLFQIFCRQGLIAPAAQDKTFLSVIEPFLKARQPAEVFDAGRNGVEALLSAAHAKSGENEQQQLEELMVGRPSPGSQHVTPGEYFLRIFDAQRLIPLDTLFVFADRVTKGGGDTKATATLNAQLARFDDVRSLRSVVTTAERSLLALGYWSERHIDQERKFTPDSLLRNAEKKDARAALTPFLRDTLVGFLYAYYAPPGAQILITNPVFVRNHDFLGTQTLPLAWKATEVAGSGWPGSAGGRLMGSLSYLPYTLAEAEQNFLTPTREQALIWGDLVPQMIVSVTIPRWNRVSGEQIRYVGLMMRRGEDLLAGATLDRELEERALRRLGHYASPARVEAVSDAIASADAQRAVAAVLPSELFSLATDESLKGALSDVPSAELAELNAAHGRELGPAAISSMFGTPKPTLTHSFQPELLNLRTFPTLMGYSSRILAETWESNNLYYAALADELGVPASQLDSYVPEWTRATVENIFATHLEDWPALLRSLRTVGDSLRRQSEQPRGAETGAGASFE
jgi:hypothetical protein